MVGPFATMNIIKKLIRIKILRVKIRYLGLIFWIFEIPKIAKYFFIWYNEDAYFYLTLGISKQNNLNWCDSWPFDDKYFFAQ